MKKILSAVFLLCFSLSCISQPTALTISTDKTVSLVFPYGIKHVDRGSPDVLIQLVKEADSVLLVKAAQKNFKATNLSVLTSDGSIYSFSVNYESNPSSWMYRLPVRTSATLETYAKGIMDNERMTHGIKDKRLGMKAEVTGIYTKGQTLFYQLSFQNSSTIDYEMEALRFILRPQKRAKRTASQEEEVMPKLMVGNSRNIVAGSKSVIVVALPGYALDDQTYLSIEVKEKVAGRNLTLKVPNRKVIEAKVLPLYQ